MRNRSTTPREFPFIHYQPALNNAFKLNFAIGRDEKKKEVTSQR